LLLSAEENILNATAVQVKLFGRLLSFVMLVQFNFYMLAASQELLRYVNLRTTDVFWSCFEVCRVFLHQQLCFGLSLVIYSRIFPDE